VGADASRAVVAEWISLKISLPLTLALWSAAGMLPSLYGQDLFTARSAMSRSSRRSRRLLGRCALSLDLVHTGLVRARRGKAASQ
jgi:hypothetical protein